MKEENNLKSVDLTLIQIGAAILCVLFISIIVSRLVYPFGVGTWEAFNWMPATHLLQGKNPYAFAFTSPYGMSPYGIVYYALIAVGVQLFGYQMWFGRILSVLAFAVCLWAIGKIAGKTARTRETVWAARLAALAMFPAQVWIAIMRSDLIAVALALSALALVFIYEKENEKTPLWRVGAAILLSAAAFFTKQTYLLAIGIVFLRFVQLKKCREALIFAAGMTSMIGGGMFLLNQTSEGGYVWQHFTHAQRLPYSFSNAITVFVEMLKQPTFSLALVGAFIFILQRFRSRRPLNRTNAVEILHSPKTLILFYFLISLIASVFSAGRIGGNINYYIETSFLLAIIVGWSVEHFRVRSAPYLASAIIVVMIAGGAWQISRVLRGEYFRWQSLSYYREIFETVGKSIPPGAKCISVYPELVVWNGCQFNFDDFEEYKGTWSPELSEIFDREIKAGNYAAIIWTDDKFTEKFPNYRLVKMSENPPERYFPVYLYMPDKPATGE